MYELNSNCSGDQTVNEPERSSTGRAYCQRAGRLWVTSALLAILLILLLIQPADAQTTTSVSSSDNPCPVALTPGQNLFTIPVLGSVNGKLQGTMILGSEQDWMTFRFPVLNQPNDTNGAQCQPQFIRTLRELGAVPTTASVPSGPFSKGAYPLPRPGPTLRARVGDLIQLTFLNQINVADFPYSVDRGETGVGGGCDESTAGYPGNPLKPGTPERKGSDTYPDCFHGSSTGNIHFHGTHTNPNTTGDNVFLEIRPSLRVDGKPIVTPESVKDSFDEFFKSCEANLSANGLPQWPTIWGELPAAWRELQEKLLKDYDRQLKKDYPNSKMLWPVDERQLKEGAWPQYYIGAYPYCFRLPAYTEQTWPPPAGSMMGMKMADMDGNSKPLMMGQSPGTHWYHAHKHGSTAINVANGMTGIFIIEGKYDDDLNAFYGKDWTRSAKVMAINQLGVSPNLMRGAAGRQDKGPDFSVNGQLKPVIEMLPGEVQMWRIANTSGRAGTYFVGPPEGVQWKQIAQDGVQFNDANYQSRANRSFLLAAGNRADLLVKAPVKPGTYSVMVQSEIDPGDLATAAKITLVSIKVAGTPVDPNSNSAKFINTAPSFPPFLTDIDKSEISGTKTIVFATLPGPGGGPGNAPVHTIDGRKFDGEVGEVVLLNKVEEWKIVNNTVGISHPFHIHINPFQVAEEFEPAAPLIDPATGKAPIDPKTKLPYVDPQTNKPAVKYAFHPDNLAPGQCYLDPDNPDTWKPCPTLSSSSPKNMIWWDVFPIPSAYAPTTDAAGKTPLLNKNGQPVQVPGYFKMRSRFVDYTGQYVIHCHILAHEDRGMMNIVEVVPYRTPYVHQ